jgi:putative ABC transport system permease protein
MTDLRLSFRLLAKSPGFTAVAILTLALGIGATTAIFSVVNGILLRPLPYAAPEQLVNIWEASQKQNLPKAPLPPGNVYDLIADNRTFAALVAFTPAALNLAGDGVAPERLDGAAVTSGFTAVVRTSPVRGRFFAPEEFENGKDAVVILSHAFWQQRFGGRAEAVGQTLQLNGRTRTVVGIMPDGFTYPGKAAAWVPYAPDAQMKSRRDLRMLRVVGRLQEGVSLAAARADLQQLNRRIAAQFPDTNADWTIDVFPMLADAVAAVRQPLYVLIAAVGALLLIACANVANLLLVRAAARRQEIAVRISLGATRGRIIRQLLTESLLLFACGGAAGVLLAQWGLGALLALAPAGIPRLDQVGIDPTALLVTAGLTGLTGLVFGLIPAWQHSRTELGGTLRTGDRGSTGRRGLVRSGLVVVQVAAAVMLLIVAGLLIRSFDQIRRVNLGFEPGGVLTFRVDLPAAKYNSPDKTAAFLAGLERELGALPGIEAVGAGTAVPLVGGPTYIMRFEGRPPVTPSNAPVARHRLVTPGYFPALGLQLLRGRAFTVADAPGSPRVCVVNQTLANKYFPGEDPIGRRLEIGFSEPPAWREIVGVVADMKTDGPEAETPVQVFEPVHQFMQNSFSLAVRTAGDPAALAPMLRAAVRKIDPAQPLHNLKPMTQLVSESLAQRTFSVVLLVVFAVVALALAVIGLYGVIAYGVAQRTREFGVRLALGAGARHILELVLREGVWLIGLGLLVGLGGAFAASRFIQSLLFGVGATDPLTFGAIAVLLATVALAACLIPARRATRVDPVVALRSE